MAGGEPAIRSPRRSTDVPLLLQPARVHGLPGRVGAVHVGAAGPPRRRQPRLRRLPVITLTLLLMFVLLMLAMSVRSSNRRRRRLLEEQERRRRQAELAHRSRGGEPPASQFAGMPFGSLFEQLLMGPGVRSLEYDERTGSWVDVSDRDPGAATQ